jgi:thiamine-phosphate pyrophosphorylase
VCADVASRKPRPSLKLYVIIDEGLLSSRNIREVSEQAILGGADAIQFRAKRLSKREYYEKALALLPVARRCDVPFFVNDHLDIALAISADGIHLGQNDLPCSAARRLVPDEMLLGVSTHSVEQAARAVDDGADYVAVGPVFRTTTKEHPEAVVGTDMVGAVRSRVGAVQLVAIGGINAGNVAEVIRSGADGVAVASAVVLADDPRLAAEQLKNEIERERARGG